jgi:hypothetical protein
MQTNNDCWTRATLRISSKTKRIDDICEKINARPSRVFNIGELCSKRNPKSKVREENLWLLKSELSDQETIESHIKHFLSLLKENREGIQELNTECEFEIFCSYSSLNGQGGFTLDY